MLLPLASDSCHPYKSLVLRFVFALFCDGGLVFVVSQSGRAAAFAVRSGLLLWELAIGGIEMPWVAGDSVFIVTLDGRLCAIRRNDGAIRWVAELPGALPIGAVAAEDIPRYVGPVVAAGKVIIVAEDGNILLFNADTGALEDEADVDDQVVQGGSADAVGQHEDAERPADAV